MSLKDSKIIVIKIGSSLLVDKNKKIRKKWLISFAKDIQKLKNKNKKVIIVSSGAIALGCIKMNYNKKSLKLDKSQAIASVGQIELAYNYSKGLEFNKPPGPVHINCPFEEPLFPSMIENSDSIIINKLNVPKINLKKAKIPLLKSFNRPVIIVGPYEENTYQEEINKQKDGLVVYVFHRLSH